MSNTENIESQQKLYTKQEYWEKYYGSQTSDISRINKIVGEYDRFWQQLIDTCKYQPKTIIEIGAYPGRYLAYLSKKYNLIPTALDYNSDTTKIKECFASFEIDDYKLIQADFLKYTPDSTYDLVISNGFVEHFEDFDTILDAHCKYLAPGGAMLVMIPNKRYLRKWYSYLVDHDNLKLHNLNVMHLSVFEKFASRNNLKANFLGYYGGFNFNVHQKLNFFQKLVHQSFRLFFKKINPKISKHPGKFYSSTIIGIYSKPATDNAL